MVFIYFIAFIVIKSTPAYSDPKKCAPSSSSNPPADDQIDHVHFMANGISKLYLDKEISDVVFAVDDEKLHAHRVVLASQSDYFRALLFGEHKEGHDTAVQIMETSATTFKILLKYIYFGRMDLSVLESRVILDLLILSNKFCLSNLQTSLSVHLRNNTGVHNASSLLVVALQCQLKELEVGLLKFIDIHLLDVLQSEDSQSLSPKEFQQILSRDTAYANELDVFRVACRWITKNQHKVNSDAKTKILSTVRYQLMIDEELAEVRQSGLVRSDTNILNVIKSRTESLVKNLNYRGQLEPDVNFAEGCPKRPLQIDGGTMIMLDRPRHINYIEMKLFELNSSFYTYYVEVSMDQYKWLRVVDHSNYHCRATQRLWMTRRFVRYIRIVGTNSTSKKPFKFLKVMYNTENMYLVEINNGLVTPMFNVASTSMDATVITGNAKTVVNNLLNGDYENYNWKRGYTYHRINSGCIEVQLAQPYMLSSMRMLLWDCDSRTYGYTVQVSVDKQNWEMIIDKSNEPCRSWQLLLFEPRLIVYIRITGTQSSRDGGFFGCVHLEAPSEVPSVSNAESKNRPLMLRLFSRK